jgi:lysophospholipase L1-like esterase
VLRVDCHRQAPGCTLRAMLRPYNRLTRRNPLRLPDRFQFMLGLLMLVVGFNELPSTVLANEGEPSIRSFERQGKAKAALPGRIVFTGSSSIAYWSSLVDDMKPLKVINSAFGGAQYTEIIDYADDLVIAYHPSAVVVYAGDNDLASPSRKTPQNVASEVRQFVEIVHSKLPETWIYVLSIKPSYARWHAWPKMKEADHLIQEFLRTQDHAQFIDVASPMFDARGDLPRDLFVGDGLHPSAKCYAMWTSIIKPILLNRFGPSKTSLRNPTNLAAASARR